MEGLGYWIFLAVLYLLSIYMKKRKKQAAHGKLEKRGKEQGEEPQSDFLRQLFGDFQEQLKPIPDTEEDIIYPDHEVGEVPQPQDTTPVKPAPVKVVYTPPESRERESANDIPEITQFLAYTNKHRVVNPYHSLFKELDAVREAIVLKEILDKPRALRRGIR